MNIANEVAALERMTPKQLRLRFAELFGETTNAGNKTWLVRRIAWRLQCQVEGGLSDRALQRAAELANDADLRVSPPKAIRSTATAVTLPFAVDPRLPASGTIISRRYRGQRIDVLVTATGFEWNGTAYKTLSAVAKAITGQHCNGYRFFNHGTETTP